MNYMDIAVLVIIGLEVFASFRRGLVKTVVEMAGWAVALVSAKLYYQVLATYLVSHYAVFKNLEGTLYQGLSQHLTNKVQIQAAAETGHLGGTIQLPKVLGSLPKEILGTGSETVNQMVYGDLAHRLSEVIINGISFMGIVFSVLCVLAVVSHVADAIMKLPLLKEANKLGGLAVGVIKGCFHVFVGMTVITFVLPFMEQTWLIDSILQSKYAVFFYNNNLLLYLIYYLLR